MSNERIGKEIKVILPTLIIACIDSERGRTPRSAWVRCIICQHYPMPDLGDQEDPYPQQSWRIT